MLCLSSSQAHRSNLSSRLSFSSSRPPASNRGDAKTLEGLERRLRPRQLPRPKTGPILHVVFRGQLLELGPPLQPRLRIFLLRFLPSRWPIEEAAEGRRQNGLPQRKGAGPPTAEGVHRDFRVVAGGS